MEKPKYKYIVVTTYTYDKIYECNAYLEKNAERVAQNGVLFFSDKIVVQVVENFKPDSWHDYAIEAIRQRVNQLVGKRLGFGEDKINLEQLKAQLSIIKPSGGKANFEALMAKQTEVSLKLQEVVGNIRLTDDEIKRAKQMLKDVEDGKIEF